MDQSGFATTLLPAALPAAPQVPHRFAGPGSPTQGLAPSGRKRDAAIARTAQEFEASFVTTMLESIYADVKTPSMFDGGPGEEMYRSLLNQEYAKAIARTGTLHIADKVRAEMLQLQERRS